MNTGIEELLREGIDRFTEGATAPAELAGRARQQHRRRQLALRAGAGAGSALAAAGAVFVATAVTPAPAVTGVTAHTAAYVITSTERALAAASARGAVQEIHVAGHDAWFTLIVRKPAHDWSSANVGDTVPASHAPKELSAPKMTVWAYRGRLRQEGFTSAGRPLFDASSTTVTSAAGRRTVTAVGVTYPGRAWWRGVTHEYVGRGPVPRSCQFASLPPPVGSPVDWPAQVREALKCGLFTVAGKQTINGVPTFKIVSAKPAPGPVKIAETLWVSQSTFLPLRTLWTWPEGQGKPAGSLAGDFQWLAPTGANLASLRTQVPPGFHRVPAAGTPQPAFSMIGRSG